MRDNDIIEKIHKIYDQKEPDVLSRLDFSKVEMKTVPEKSLNKRYFSAAAVYAAACLVIAIVLPFLIGGRGDEPKPVPSNSDVRTETSGEENNAPKSDDTNSPLEVNIVDGVPEEYHEVLVRYRSAVEAIVKNNIVENDGKLYSPYEPVHYLTAGMCEAGQAMKSPETEKYGYSLKDMNGDGTPELLLITENHVLLEIYSIVDGEAQMVEYFWPRYTGVVLTTNRIYTHGSNGAGYDTYTLSKYDGDGKFVPYLEFGSDVSDDGQYYYKVTDGGEREIITEKNFLSLCERYPEIPVFAGEDNVFDLDVEYHSISPTIMDKFMKALERGVEEGRIEDRNYNRDKLDEIKNINTETTDIHAFMFYDIHRVFVYSDGEAYPVTSELPVYMVSSVQTCDVDKNGKDDLLMYEMWGSGVPGNGLSYFDSGTKTVTSLHSGILGILTVEEETNSNGDVQYSLYYGRHYIGRLKYENGKIVTDLIYEGSISEIARALSLGEEVVTKYPEETASNDVSPIPVETEKAAKPTPETVAPEKPEPEMGKKPSIAEPAVSTSKAPVTTPASVVTAPVTTVPDAGFDTPVFINPPATADPKAATASTLRFYKDKEMTEEYASAADIPYGAVVYYEVVSDPGYICTRLQMNVYEISRKNDSHDYIQYDNVFVNNYSGDGLEYSTYSALAGDVDENLVYNLRDVVILLKALVGDYGVVGMEGGTWGDYDCNGRCNLADIAGVLKEAAKWDMDRNRPCPNTFDIVCLLPIDKTDVYRDVLIDYNIFESSYIVVDNTTEANRYSIPQEWIEKYDDPFYEKYSLVAFNACNSDGSEAKLTKLWYHTSYNYVIPEFENTDVKLGEGYTMCILVDSSIKVYENYPR